MRGRGAVLGALLVLAVGALAVLRYLQLIREHPEASQGFEALLGMSLATLAVFAAGLTAILRGERGGQPQ